MAKRLIDNLTTGYIGTINRLGKHHGRRRIVAYVEGYDDIFFWRSLLGELETEEVFFEVMLPSRSSLGKGKKVALMSALSRGVGENLIVCVDADYDYLMQGATEVSELLCTSPYIFHTYAYAIENFQCYAPSLHEVCVMATLNDRRLFDFVRFFTDYSEIIFPLFVWSIWAYRHGRYSKFSLQDFGNVIRMGEVNLQQPQRALDVLRKHVNVRINTLQRTFPEAKRNLKQVEEDILNLGVTPQTTYSYVRGHDLMETLVVPLMTQVCRRLTKQRREEIQRLASHETQLANELAGYEHSSASVEEMLRKQTNYKRSPLYQNILKDVQQFLLRTTPVELPQAENPSPNTTEHA